MRRLRQALLATALLALPVAAQPAITTHSINAPGPSAPEEWTVYGGTCNSQRHSPLAQITPADIVRNGIPGTGMPAWDKRLSQSDILAIGAYVHALRGTALDNPWPGDPAHGAQVFWGKGECASCHMMDGRGSAVGPDLSNIAVQRKAAAIGDALTKAQHRVFGDGGIHLPAIPPMDYNPVTVLTRDGRTIAGVMRNQDHWSVQIVSLDGKFHSFDRAKLASVTIAPASIMPSDYDKRLSPGEFADLMAFLTRQGSQGLASRDAP